MASETVVSDHHNPDEMVEKKENEEKKIIKEEETKEQITSNIESVSPEIPVPEAEEPRPEEQIKPSAAVEGGAVSKAPLEAGSKAEEISELPNPPDLATKPVGTQPEDATVTNVPQAETPIKVVLDELKEEEVEPVVSEERKEKEVAAVVAEEPKEKEVAAVVAEEPKEKEVAAVVADKPKEKEVEAVVAAEPKEKEVEAIVAAEPKEKEVEVVVAAEPKEKEVEAVVAAEPKEKEVEAVREVEPQAVTPEEKEALVEEVKVESKEEPATEEIKDKAEDKAVLVDAVESKSEEKPAGEEVENKFEEKGTAEVVEDEVKEKPASKEVREEPKETVMEEADAKEPKKEAIETVVCEPKEESVVEQVKEETVDELKISATETSEPIEAAASNAVEPRAVAEAETKVEDKPELTKEAEDKPKLTKEAEDKPQEGANVVEKALESIKEIKPTEKTEVKVARDLRSVMDEFDGVTSSKEEKIEEAPTITETNSTVAEEAQAVVKKEVPEDTNGQQSASVDDGIAEEQAKVEPEKEEEKIEKLEEKDTDTSKDETTKVENVSAVTEQNFTGAAEVEKEETLAPVEAQEAKEVKAEEEVENGIAKGGVEDAKPAPPPTNKPAKDGDDTEASRDLPAQEVSVKKQSGNIMSKVKQLGVKVKKAIVGKSPSSKTLTTEAKIEEKVK